MSIGNENDKKIRKSKLAKNNFAYAAHFFVHFSVVVLHDYNVKLSSYMFYQGRNLLCVLPCLYFSLPLIFTLVATSISHFLTAAINFSRFSSNKIHLLCFFFFISHSTPRLT